MFKKENLKYTIMALAAVVAILLIYQLYRAAPQASEVATKSKTDNCTNTNIVFTEGNVLCIRVVEKDRQKPVKSAVVKVTIPGYTVTAGTPTYSGSGAPLAKTAKTNTSGFAQFNFDKIPKGPVGIAITNDFIVIASKPGYKKHDPVTLKAFVGDKVINRTIKLELKHENIKAVN